jgi:hypothetical protein
MESATFDPSQITNQTNEHLKNIENQDEIVSCRAMTGIASLFRLAFVHIVNLSVDEAPPLKQMV